jgi:hypothetical protein
MQKVAKYGEKDIEMVKLMFEQMHLNYPNIRQKEIREVDYEIMNKLHRIDGNDYELIKAVIMWCQQDDFWKQNIRSVNKLRIKFDDLRIRGESWFKAKQKNRIVEI